MRHRALQDSLTLKSDDALEHTWPSEALFALERLQQQAIQMRHFTVLDSLIRMQRRIMLSARILDSTG